MKNVFHTCPIAYSGFQRDTPPIIGPRLRYAFLALWLGMISGALYLYFFKRDAVQAELTNALSVSFWAAVSRPPGRGQDPARRVGA